MIVDGMQAANELFAALKDDIQNMETAPTLTVFTCAPDFATRKFLSIKEKRAEELGVDMRIIELDQSASSNDIRARIARAAESSDGVIVQLPFPDQFKIADILSAVPLSRDVDAIGSEAEQALKDNKPLVLSPVVASIQLLAEQNSLDFKNKKVLVVGEGRLVGKPAAVWFKNQGAEVTTLSKKDEHTLEHTSEHIQKHTKTADVLVLGAGVPGLVTPEMVQEGAVIFDAGTSEAEGKLVGDADPRCAEKASLFTPVPGGIGPITVAMIFRNLVTLTAVHQM